MLIKNLVEHLTANYVNWQLVSMTEYKGSVTERLGRSEVRVEKGSPLCEKFHRQIVQQLNNICPC